MIRLFLLYAAGYLLLLEWLWPVQALTDTVRIHVFTGFAGLALLLSFLRLPAFVSVPLKALYTAVAVAWLHTAEQGVWMEIRQNSTALFSGEWAGITDSFRTLLFFVLIWMVTYLIHYWLTVRQSLLFFFFMTVLFVATLDTFTPYDATNAIIRIVAAGLFAAALLTAGRQRTSWLYPALFAVFFISASVSAAYFLPKQAPLWPDPVPFLTSWNTSGSSSQGGGETGFRTDDSELGGPFNGSNTLVFRAEVEEPHYWKVETRDVYTGKGWVVSNPNANRYGFQRAVPDDFFSFTNRVPSEPLSSTVFNEADFGHIQYPHGLNQIDPGVSSYLFELQTATGKIMSYDEGEQRAPSSYSVRFDQPDFEAAQLDRSSPLSGDPQFRQVASLYTQLPDSLPAEVRELAFSVTAAESTWFGKAKAIEEYFGENGFIYDQENVPVPSEEEDYVAQFLFDTKRGYCDNYSTSMAVMLRAIGIPARWVKGYTEGTYLETLRDGRQLYQVTNLNAHSWVEAYFPGVGWVPFEPTQGFSNSAVPDRADISESPAMPNEPTEPAAPTDVPGQEEQTETPEEELTPEETTAQSSGSSPRDWSGVVKPVAAAAAAFLFAAFFIVMSRKWWLAALYITRFKNREDDAAFPLAYNALLQQLALCGFKRQGGQTLREYAAHLDAVFGSDAMTTLTGQFERLAYSKDGAGAAWIEVKDDWLELMKKSVKKQRRA